MILIMLFVLYCNTLAALYRAENCCSTNLQQAIKTSDLTLVKKLLDNPEQMPLSVENQKYKQLAQAITQQREIDKSKGAANVGKVNFGTMIMAAGLLNALNIIYDIHERNYFLAGITGFASITAMYQGGKMILDGLFKKEESNKLAQAIAIEQMLTKNEIKN